jgi:hypothetical protein
MTYSRTTVEALEGRMKTRTRLSCHGKRVTHGARYAA